MRTTFVMKLHVWLGLLIMAIAVFLFIYLPQDKISIGGSLVVLVVGIVLTSGALEKLEISLGPVRINATYQEVQKEITSLTEIEPKELPERVVQERREVAATLPLPDREAPAFSLFEHTLELEAIPRAGPMLPMYMLDRHYRIVDWNLAFGLAFERTMEGRRGMSVSEWVFFLENYEEVLEHGVRAFSDPDNLPLVDIETVRFNNRRYGALRAKKRAYRIPRDDGECLGWLATLEPSFADPRKAQQFQLDLIELLRMDLVWSEYSLYYDAVLLNTNVYPELLSMLLGERDGLPPIRPRTSVLDLGAGTGNITYRLADPADERLVFALENNVSMLNVLKRKCRDYLRTDNLGPGVLAIKQDVTSLYGLPDEYFDYALLNNVSYALDDPEGCLCEVERVLRPGGEIRLSGPQKRTDLSKLLKQIRTDLETKGVFQSVVHDYQGLVDINKKYLEPMLHRWDIEDVKEHLLKAGFSQPTYSTGKAYAGQSMIVCAQKG